MTTKENPTINEEELKKSAAQLGQKLGLLITLLFPKPEEQQAMLVVAEKMSPAQLLELTETLEAKYIEAFGKSLDDQYGQEVKAAVGEYQTNQATADKEILSKLAALEAELTGKK